MEDMEIVVLKLNLYGKLIVRSREFFTAVSVSYAGHPQIIQNSNDAINRRPCYIIHALLTEMLGLKFWVLCEVSACLLI